MTKFEVNLVTAFGRGETLALALEAQGFSVRVLDFTTAFPAEYCRGPGPFPIDLKAFLPEQNEWLGEATKLPRGLAFWLPDGPLELSGPMAPFYLQSRKDVQNVKAGANHSDFKVDWLRRFLIQWASPLQTEAWQPGSPAAGSPFPWSGELGLIPTYEEEQVMCFERFRAKGHPVINCKSVQDLQFDGARLSEIAVEAGQAMAFEAPQWVWCLSSRETEILNSGLAGRIFTKGVWRPDWSWVSFGVTCEHGPWVEGFPMHTIVIGDLCLPWVYANMAVLRRCDPEGFRVWIKVPSKAVGDETQRRRWGMELEEGLSARLRLARWSVNTAEWGICPHSPVFAVDRSDSGVPSWKNWDWIAPERLPRLDFSARLELEAKSFQRLVQWRSDQLKKQGASRDSAVHAP